MSEQHSLIDEPMSARYERREGMMMTTPYPNGTEPNSYPGQVPQPPAANYSQVPQPPAVHYGQAPQPAPFGQNPGKSPGKASFGCGVAGLVLFGVVIVIGLVAWVGFAMTSTDSLERALAPLGFIFIVGLGSIPVGLINLIGAILGVAAMNQVRTPEEGKYVSRALRLNAIPVVVVMAAVLLFLLLSVVLSSAYGF